jgi:glucose-1-phosphate thymidylyltransferase
VKSLEELGKAKASIPPVRTLRTGYAMCAKSLSGRNCYADTLIRADFDLDPQADAVIC